MKRKLLGIFLTSVFAVFALSAVAQPERYVAGTHYSVLDSPVRTADASRIEVIELFWYGCPACYQFEPLIANWEENAPADVDCKRLPAVWNPITKLHARAFFTAQRLNVIDAVHNPIFDAYHRQGNRLHNQKTLAELFASQGVDTDDFDSAFESFSVVTKLNQAQKTMNDYGNAGTPSLYVNGKYIVTLADAGGSYQEMLNIVDFLVNKERRALKPAV